MTDIFDMFQLLAITFLLCIFLLKTLVLVVKYRIKPFKLGKGKKGFNAFLELSFFPGLALWMIEVIVYSLDLGFTLFPYPFSFSLLNHSTNDVLSIANKMLGVVMITFGFFLFISALFAFGQSWRIGIDMDSPGQLITGGVFAFSRNPIYLFLDLYFTGTFLLNGTLIFLLFTLITVLGLHYQIIQEEVSLEKMYGESYRSYKQSTSRYLGMRHRTGFQQRSTS
ncbi:MAG: methyltransferase family protein [Candidatus Odinarchaeota archaeon]